MTDHPLYLRRITLPDGRRGTVIEVYPDGALCVEPEGATSIDDCVTIQRTNELIVAADFDKAFLDKMRGTKAGERS